MSSKHFIRLGLVAAMLIPSIAVAYTSPEETLTNDNNAAFFFPPPPHGGAAALEQVAQQQSSAAARRAAEQAKLFQKSTASSSSASSMHAADEEAGSDDTEWTTDETDTWTEPTDEELRDERILERVKARQIAEEASGSQSDTALHSGAPLIPSGPATDVSVAVLLAVAGWTMYRARQSEKSA